MPKNKQNYYSQNPVRRLGNKQKLIRELSKYTPQNFDAIVSLFFGTGAFELSFIGEVKNIIANDYDNEISNVYDVLVNNSAELLEEIEMLSIHSEIWGKFKSYKEMNLGKVKNAMFFLLYSNLGYMGKPDTLRVTSSNDKLKLLKNIQLFYKNIVSNEKTAVLFLNYSFENVLSKISFRDNDKEKTFLFCDPPYLEATNNYSTPKWKFSDHELLHQVCIKSGMPFMICEFDQPKILELAKKNDLFITKIGERRNMKNIRTEIIITNYNPVRFEQKKLL